MKIVIHKKERTLALTDGGAPVFACRIALGRAPEGPKQREGDGRTPEGSYFICLVKEAGKYGRSLGLSYPNAQDAQLAYQEGRIDEKTLENVEKACAEGRRPPWGSKLGGEIYIHEGGSGSDWTAGCIALENKDVESLFSLCPLRTRVLIIP